MKLKFERYPQLSCLYIRDELDESSLRVFMAGLDFIIKNLEEPLIVHLGNAILSAPTLKVLIALKAKYKPISKHELIWISSERTLGDFNNLGLYLSRLNSPKQKPVATRILLDDSNFLLQKSNDHFTKQITELGGTPENIEQMLLETEKIRGQLLVLKKLNSHLALHSNLSKPTPSQDEEIQTKLKEALDKLHTHTQGDLGL